MSAKTAITAEEYLRTSFPDLDKEFRDGELVERSLPDDPHSETQAALIYCFKHAAKERQLPLHTRPELRLRLRPGLYLIPDVCVFYPDRPKSPVPDSPPLVSIEILSPDDRMNKVREKLEDYRTWGVWLVDPYSRRMYTCDAALNEVSTLRVPELNIEFKPADVFGT